MNTNIEIFASMKWVVEFANACRRENITAINRLLPMGGLSQFNQVHYQKCFVYACIE